MRPCFILGLATFALACADRPSLTAPASDATPSLSVERGTVPFGFAFSDGRNIVFVGLTVADLVSIFCTGTPFDVDEVNQILVTRPDGSTKWQLQGNPNVTVVDVAAFGQDGVSFCEDPSAVPTYTGTPRIILNDSDVDLSGPGADASQLHVRGTVTDESEQRYHLVAFTQAVIAPEETDLEDFVFRHENVKIKLTPRRG